MKKMKIQKFYSISIGVLLAAVICIAGCGKGKDTEKRAVPGTYSPGNQINSGEWERQIDELNNILKNFNAVLGVQDEGR